MNRKFIFLLITVLSVHFSMAQKVIPLYDGSIPDSKPDAAYKEMADTGADGVTRISKVSIPTLQIFYPDSNNDAHTAVIVCPGGGYSILAYNKEGTKVARAMTRWGITAFVLKYRLPSDAIMDDKAIGPLQDAQRAVQLVRQEAGKWNIDPSKIGIMGFSAGGHLAATASTHYKKPEIPNPLRTSLRPDFTILAYPVITMRAFTHKGSRTQLLGKAPDSTTIDAFSNELLVTPNTPPAFLVLAADDKAVPPENSIRYFEALIKNNVPAEMHIYQNGGHGFGMNEKANDPWMERLKHWMEHNHFIN